MTDVERLIKVFGEAEVRVVPDEVIISLGVQTSDKQMLLATDAARRRANYQRSLPPPHVDEKTLNI